MDTKIEKINNKKLIQRGRVSAYLDHNVSISDLNTGPTEFTERWLFRFKKKGVDYIALPSDIMKFYLEKTRMLIL